MFRTFEEEPLTEMQKNSMTEKCRCHKCEAPKNGDARKTVTEKGEMQSVKLERDAKKNSKRANFSFLFISSCDDS